MATETLIPFSLEGTTDQNAEAIRQFIAGRGGAGTLAITINGWVRLRQQLATLEGLARLLERGEIDIAWPDDDSEFVIDLRERFEPPYDTDEYGTPRTPTPRCATCHRPQWPAAET